MAHASSLRPLSLAQYCGCPILRALCEGWVSQQSTRRELFPFPSLGGPLRLDLRRAYLPRRVVQKARPRPIFRPRHKTALDRAQIRVRTGSTGGGSWPPTLESEGDSRMGHPARHGCLGMPDQGASTTFRKTYSISSIERKYLAKRIWIGTLKSACGVFFASWIWFRASARQSGQNAVVSLRGHRKQPQIFRLRCAPLKMTTSLWLCLNHRS